ncbi:hypothetical protein [Bacillus sp. D386]|uniref:hypothetical protein n=1 Tax=Bacillus sp. D386 TaxID=2587155 RepID=UPI00111DB659|nr:hypothetical protein [Bacillus sp. D386]
MSTLYICTTCGTQTDCLNDPPVKCLICSEERQYINRNGQQWTTMEEMVSSKQFKNEIKYEEKDLYSMKTEPDVGIGQTAYIVQSDNFTLLWDCITYIDQLTVDKIKKKGGLHAIALSHPHYYSSQIEWAEAFDIPIYIHEDDQEWVLRKSEKIVFWSGESLKLSEGLILHRLGGHFKGGAVLEWNKGNHHKGILLTGDIIQVVADRKWVSFMYSYPNLIPLPAKKVMDIADKVAKMNFDRIYNAFHRIIQKDAKQAVQKSAERYIKALNGTLFET